VHRVLAAWEAATNGQPHALDQLADPRAAHELLSAKKGLPHVIREPRLRKITLIEVDANAAPPTISFLGSIEAHPDIWHLDVCWQLKLSDNRLQPWILASTNAWKASYSYTRDSNPPRT